jgi:hypothetical protein
MNQTLLGRLRAGFIHDAVLSWWDNLEDAIVSINATRAASTKTAPNRLWQPGYNRDPIGPEPALPLDHDPSNAELAGIAAVNSRANAARMLSSDMSRRFEVGQRVRVSMAAISSDYRKKVKEGRAKQLSVHWSTEVFVIRRVLPARQTVRERYSLVGVRGGSYFGNQLLAAAGDAPTSVLTREQAAAINRLP